MGGAGGEYLCLGRGMKPLYEILRKKCEFCGSSNFRVIRIIRSRGRYGMASRDATVLGFYGCGCPGPGLNGVSSVAVPERSICVWEEEKA